MRSFLIPLLALPAMAHSLYLMPQKFRTAPGDTLVLSIQNGDSFPEGDGAPVLQRLRDCVLVSVRNSTAIADLRIEGKAAQATTRTGGAGTYWLAVRTIPNFLTLDPAAFETYLKEEGLDAALRYRAEHGESGKPSRELYSKFAKSLVVASAPDGAWSKVLGHEFEFIPDADPAALKPGGALPVRLLWRGQPAAGIQVESAWAAGGANGVAVVGRTDREGRISVPIDRAGKWRLHAVTMERTTGSKEADWVSFWASMTFEVTEPRP